MAEVPVAKKAVAWPRVIPLLFLTAYVAVDAALWIAGAFYLMQGMAYLTEAGTYLTLALVLLLVAGWAWRWFVARGWIGGRPTARFGGA